VTSETRWILPRRQGALPSLNYALPEENIAQQRMPGSRVGRLAGLIMYAFALWMAVQNNTFRGLEARMVAPLAGLVAGHHPVNSQKAVIFFAMGTRRAFGLQITSECTSALLLIPLLAMMGSIAIFTRFPLARVLAALAAGASLMLAVNAFRIVGIAWATWKYGYDPGYKYSHVFVGSACSLVGFVGAILVALWLLVWRDRKALSAPIGIAGSPDAGPPPSHRGDVGPRARLQLRRRSDPRHRR
jgi:exosortase/archaeosortase family protein